MGKFYHSPEQQKTKLRFLGIIASPKFNLESPDKREAFCANARQASFWSNSKFRYYHQTIYAKYHQHGI